MTSIKLTCLLLALTTLSSVSYAQQNVSLNRNINEKTGMIELCNNYYLYSNSINQERDCLIGKDDGKNFKVDHTESNGLIHVKMYCGAHQLSEACQQFGYKKATFRATKKMNSEQFQDQVLTSDAKFVLASNCDADFHGQVVFYNFTDVVCVK